jgi:hypothetical protein
MSSRLLVLSSLVLGWGASVPLPDRWCPMSDLPKPRHSRQPFHESLRWRRRVSRALDLLLEDDHYPNVDERYAVVPSHEPEDVVHR